MPKETIDVILGIYKPASYLTEQLQSLANQIEVKINLIIGVDSDEKDLDPYRQLIATHFPSAKIYHGPRMGPSKNYFFLLEHTNSKFVAFCDQDDVWAPNHLIDSILRIKDHSHLPALSFTNVIEFGNKPIRVWPKKISHNISSMIFENPARGCTMVMNDQARDILNSAIKTGVIMHDWFTLVMIRAIGFVAYSEDPEVLYRLHENNAVGRGAKLSIKKLTSVSFYGPHPAITQYMSIMELCHREKISIELEALKWEIAFRNKKIFKQFFCSPVRIHLVENFIYKIYLLYLFWISKLLKRPLYESL